MIKKVEIELNTENGFVNCENLGNLTDQQLVGIFEVLKHLYLDSIRKKAKYNPNFSIGTDFDSDIKE